MIYISRVTEYFWISAKLIYAQVTAQKNSSKKKKKGKLPLQLEGANSDIADAE